MVFSQGEFTDCSVTINIKRKVDAATLLRSKSITNACIGVSKSSVRTGLLCGSTGAGSILCYSVGLDKKKLLANMYKDFLLGQAVHPILVFFSRIFQLFLQVVHLGAVFCCIPLLSWGVRSQ